jgi:hypothetical protein
MTVLLGALGICAANYGNTSAKLPVNNKTYTIIKDTVPSDTTKPKDSTLLLK